VKELTIVVNGEKVLEENSNTFSDLVVTECQHSVDVNFAGRAYDFRWKMASWWVHISSPSPWQLLSTYGLVCCGPGSR
jgi:hypothetical protein